MEATAEGEEEADSTAAVAEDFMEAAEQRFAGVEVSLAAAALGLSADARSADIVAATTGVAAVTAGAAGATAGAEDTVTDGAGELALDGRIGVGDGDIRTLTITPGITGRTLMMLTRITVLRTIPMAIRIRTMGTTILHREIPMRGPCPTRTARQDPGDHPFPYQEAERIQTMKTTGLRPLRRVERFSLLTG